MSVKDLLQAAEKVRQRRSRIVQALNVPQRVRLGPSLAVASLDGLFEQPADRTHVALAVRTFVCGRANIVFPQTASELGIGYAHGS